MEWASILVCLVWGALQVQVTPVAGEPFAAELTAIDDAGIRLQVGGESRLWKAEQISRLERSGVEPELGPVIAVGLRDGSRLKADSVAIAGKDLRVTLRNQPVLSIAVKEAAWIRYRAPSDGLNDAWLGFLNQESAADRLIVRRSATAIDQMSGIVQSADGTKVEFDLGEQVVPAPVARLEGVLFGGRSEMGDTPLIVTDQWGSEWGATAVHWVDSGAELRVTLSNGQERQLAIDQFRSLRFKGTATRLADEQPLEKKYVPMVELSLDKQLVEAWFGPQSNESGDLVLQSRTSLVYRVEPKHKTFVAQIAPASSVASGTGAMVRVYLDDRIVWSETVMPDDAPRGVEIGVDNARRLTLEVDFGDGEARGDTGDIIRFVEPRLLQ